MDTGQWPGPPYRAMWTATAMSTCLIFWRSWPHGDHSLLARCADRILMWMVGVMVFACACSGTPSIEELEQIIYPDITGSIYIRCTVDGKFRTVAPLGKHRQYVIDARIAVEINVSCAA